MRQEPNLSIPTESFAFCQQSVDLALDIYRLIGKNTHELIVLPVFWQVLPANSFGLWQ